MTLNRRLSSIIREIPRLLFIAAILMHTQYGLAETSPSNTNSPARSGTTAGEEQVDFRFDQVEIRFLVKIVGELTGKRFAIDDKVQGRITIVTPGKIPVSEIYPMFVSILDGCGYSVIEQHGISRVVARGD